MIAYNPAFLDNVDIFSSDDLKLLEGLSTKVSLEKFLDNKSYVYKFGLDFIHTSALIDGNTYQKVSLYSLSLYLQILKPDHFLAWL